MLKNGINCIDFLGIHFAILSHWKCIFTHKCKPCRKVDGRRRLPYSAFLIRYRYYQVISPMGTLTIYNIENICEYQEKKIKKCRHADISRNILIINNLRNHKTKKLTSRHISRSHHSFSSFYWLFIG